MPEKLFRSSQMFRRIKGQKRRHKSRAWSTRDWTNGDCCGSASVNSMIGGETEAYCLARRCREFQSADHEIFVCLSCTCSKRGGTPAYCNISGLKLDIKVSCMRCGRIPRMAAGQSHMLIPRPTESWTCSSEYLSVCKLIELAMPSMSLHLYIVTWMVN